MSSILRTFVDSHMNDLLAVLRLRRLASKDFDLRKRHALASLYADGGSREVVGNHNPAHRQFFPPGLYGTREVLLNFGLVSCYANTCYLMIQECYLALGERHQSVTTIRRESERNAQEDLKKNFEDTLGVFDDMKPDFTHLLQLTRGCVDPGCTQRR